MLFYRTWKGLEKGGFSKWLRKRFGFLFRKVLSYPKMDITYETPDVMLIHGVVCSIKHNPPKDRKISKCVRENMFHDL